MPSKLSKRLDRFPPFLCYALCTVKLPRVRDTDGWKWQERRRWRRINRQELSERTGIPERSIERYVQRVTWQDFVVGDMLRFLDGCGIDLMHVEPTMKKLKNISQSKTRFQHLTTVQRAMLMRKFREWKGRAG